MTTTGRCPVCGGELRVDTRKGVKFSKCLSCGAALLDAAAFNRLLPPETLPGPTVGEHDYPYHHPQDDHGHASARPQPPFAPTWSASPPKRRGDGRGLMFGR